MKQQVRRPRRKLGARQVFLMAVSRNVHAAHTLYILDRVRARTGIFFRLGQSAFPGVFGPVVFFASAASFNQFAQCTPGSWRCAPWLVRRHVGFSNYNTNAIASPPPMAKPRAPGRSFIWLSAAMRKKPTTTFFFDRARARP